MFEIHTFQNPVSFYRNFSVSKGELHLTGTTNLMHALMDIKDIRKSGAVVTTYDQLMKKLYPKWNDPFIQLYLKSKLKDLAGKEFRESFYASFRFAVELGINHFPIYNELTSNQIAFQSVFEKMLQDVTVQKLLQEMRESLSMKLHRIFGIPIVRVVAHQMKTMDAVRMGFFHRIKQQGISVRFLIPQDPLYPAATQGWKKLFAKIGGKGSEWMSLDSPKPITRGHHYLQLLTGQGVEEKVEKTYTTCSFTHLVSFQSYIKKYPPVKDKVHYVAPSSETFDEWFRGVFQKEEEQPFAHPSEKFLFYLYECKKENGEIRLTYDTFLACITSGWIQPPKGAPGKNALTFLEECRPYFTGIETLQDIKKRLENLEELREASKIFDDMAAPIAGRNRIKRYLANPFRVYPYVHNTRFSITLRQLKEVTDYFGKAVDYLLPEEGEKMLASEHLKRLSDLLVRVHKQQKDYFFLNSLQSSNLIEPWVKGVDPEIAKSWKVGREEARELVAQILSRLKKRNEEEMKPFHAPDQLEGLILRTKECLHITDLSLKSVHLYLGQWNQLPDPLTHTWLKEAIMEKKPGVCKILLHCLLVDYEFRHVQDSLFKSMLYHLFCFYEGKVEVSWIDGIHDYDSPYYIWSALHEGEKEEPGIFLEDDFVFPNEEGEQTDEKLTVWSEKMDQEIPLLYWLDFDFCARKFFLTSFVQLQPMYIRDFHQRLAFATIGKILASTADKGDGVFTHLNPLFPQWTDTLKKNLIQTSYGKNIRRIHVFQNMNYPFDLRDLQKLRSLYRVGGRWKAAYAFKKDRMNIPKEWSKEFLSHLSEKEVRGEADGHCMMCPYLNLCDKGVYPIEYSNH